MFEGWRKPKVEKTEAQKEMDKKQNRAKIALGVSAAAAVGSAYGIHEQNKSLKDLSHPTPASAPATAENPTLGKRAGDAPEKITIPAPTAGEAVAVDLGEKQVTIDAPEVAESVTVDLGERQVTIDRPER